MAPGKVDFGSKPVEPASADVMVLAEMAVPQLAACRRIRERELEDRVEPSNEGGIEPASPIRRKQRNPVEILDPLEEEIGLSIGMTIIRVADLGSGAEQGVS